MADIRIVTDSSDLPRSLSKVLTEELWLLLTDLRDDLSVTPENLQQSLAAVQSRHFFAINAKDQLVGYADLHWWHAATGKAGYVQMVVVKKSEQQKGIGTLLMNAVVDAARALGLPEFHLHTSTWRTGAEALYKSLGFIRENNIVLTKEVGGQQ